jgi:hypothetical protein
MKKEKMYIEGLDWWTAWIACEKLGSIVKGGWLDLFKPSK